MILLCLIFEYESAWNFLVICSKFNLLFDLYSAKFLHSSLVSGGIIYLFFLQVLVNPNPKIFQALVDEQNKNESSTFLFLCVLDAVQHTVFGFNPASGSWNRQPPSC